MTVSSRDAMSSADMSAMQPMSKLEDSRGYILDLFVGIRTNRSCEWRKTAYVLMKNLLKTLENMLAKAIVL